MKELSRKEKLHNVALEALEYYDVSCETLEFFTEDTNVFFKVSTLYDTYMLKIFQEESSKLEDNLAEVFFMNEIDQRTDIVIPSIIKSKNGDSIVILKSQYFEIEKRIALYSFIEGVDLNGNETNDLFYKLGQACAKLHNASEQIKIPDSISPKKWDTVFYYRDEPIVYNDNKYKDITLEENREFLDKFIPYLNEKLKEYYQRPSFIIHADLNPWNVKIYNNEIRLLDFEEAMYASEVHDLAILLFYYRYDQNYNYDVVKSNVLDGYQSVRQLPEITDFDIDLLIMARTANFVNYTLYWYESDPTEYFRSRVKRMMDFVDTYNVKL